VHPPAPRSASRGLNHSGTALHPLSHLKFVLGGPVAMSVVGMIAIKGHRAARGRLRLVFAGVRTTMARSETPAPLL
jgi:hypothetical protein